MLKITYDRLPRLSSFELNYSYKPYVGKKHYYAWATVQLYNGSRNISVRFAKRQERFREKWVSKTNKNIFLVTKLQLDGLI